MEDRHNLMAYYRKGDKTLLVVGNYQWDEQEITLPSECKKVLINNYPDMVLDGNSVKLQWISGAGCGVSVNDFHCLIFIVFQHLY